MAGDAELQARMRRLAWTAVAVGAALRLLWVLVIHPPYEHVYSDMQGYVNRAMRVATGESLDPYDAFYPPGTHLLLGAILKVFGSGAEGLRAGALAWWAMSSLVPLFAWRLARRLIGEGPGALTAVLVALYPPFVLYGGYFSSETPSLMLLTGALWLAYRARQVAGRPALAAAAGAGLLGGAAIANRPQFLLNLAVVAVPLVVVWRSERRRLLALAAGLLFAVAPIVAYNSAASDRLTALSTNGGLNFFQSHCDVHVVEAGSPQKGGVYTFGSPVPFARNEGHDYKFPDRQVWDQGFFFAKGMSCIGDDGLSHLGLLGKNILDATATTTPWPLINAGPGRDIAHISNLIYALLLPFIVIAALVQWRRTRRPGERDLLLHLACLLPVLLVFDAEPRFRIPYDVFALALLASTAWAGRTWVSGRLPSRLRPSTPEHRPSTPEHRPSTPEHRPSTPEQGG